MGLIVIEELGLLAIFVLLFVAAERSIRLREGQAKQQSILGEQQDFNLKKWIDFSGFRGTTKALPKGDVLNTLKNGRCPLRPFFFWL
jgi:hypothetical protein